MHNGEDLSPGQDFVDVLGEFLLQRPVAQNLVTCVLDHQLLWRERRVRLWRNRIAKNAEHRDKATLIKKKKKVEIFSFKPQAIKQTEPTGKFSSTTSSS